MEKALEEKVSPSAGSEGGFSEELTKEEKEKLQHRARARTYYWRHRDRLREVAKDRHHTKRENTERQQRAESNAFAFMIGSLIAAGVVGAVFIIDYLYERNQRLQQDAARLAEPAPPEEPSVQFVDIGGGRMLPTRDGKICSV